MKDPIILVGGGGHCKACIDVIEQQGLFQVAGIVDTSEKKNQKILGYRVIATDDDLPSLVKDYKNMLITVGQVRAAEPRIRLFKTLRYLKAKLPVIISPLSYTSKHASLGDGTIIMHHAVVNANAVVGENCIINNKALVEHDATISDHCHVSTGAIVNGGVRIGRNSFIGSNSVIKEGVDIGSDCIVGAGVALYHSLPPSSTVRALDP